MKVLNYDTLTWPEAGRYRLRVHWWPSVCLQKYKSASVFVSDNTQLLAAPPTTTKQIIRESDNILHNPRSYCQQLNL